MKLFDRFIRLFSIFVLIGDGVVLIYFITINSIDAVSGKYGESSYEIVVVVSIVCLLAITFYAGSQFERRQESKRRRANRNRLN